MPVTHDAYVPDVTLTVPKTLKLLREVVADKGKDFVYQPVGGNNNPCTYVHGNRPGCIVGQVLHRIGVPIKVLRGMDHFGVVPVAVQEGAISLPDEVVEVLYAAQYAQDHERTYGEALADAKTRAAELKKTH